MRLLVTYLVLAVLALPAVPMVYAWDQPRTAEERAVTDMLWNNSTTAYVAQEQVVDGNLWIEVALRHYPSADKYGQEGFALAINGDKLVALWAIQEAATDESAKLEQDTGVQALDLTGIKSVVVINGSMPKTDDWDKKVLFARSTTAMPIAGLTVDKLDNWIKAMTTDMDLIKSQYYVGSPTYNFHLIWDAGAESLITAPVNDKAGITMPYMSRARRANPSIQEYPMWLEPKENPERDVKAHGVVSIEGYAVDMHGASWGCGPAMKERKVGYSYIPDGDCPSSDSQNYVTLFNNDSRTVNLAGWKIQWDEQISSEADKNGLNGIQVRRNEFIISDLTLAPGQKVNYPIDYKYNDPKTPYSTIKLFNKDGRLEDEWGVKDGCNDEWDGIIVYTKEPVEVTPPTPADKVHIPFVMVNATT